MRRRSICIPYSFSPEISKRNHENFLTVCSLLTFLVLTAYAGQPSAMTADSKLEIQNLTVQIIAAKAAGRTPDAALYARLFQLAGQSRTSSHSLDQGNDACPATVITALPYTDTGSTLGMVDDFVASGGMGKGPDVIYVFIAAIAGNYTVSLCGSSYDTGLIIRTGGSCPGTTEIAANDDYCGLSSQASFFLRRRHDLLRHRRCLLRQQCRRLFAKHLSAGGVAG